MVKFSKGLKTVSFLGLVRDGMIIMDNNWECGFRLNP